MAHPVRLQLRRTPGFRLQEISLQTNGLVAVKVDRGTLFGNPFSIESLGRSGAIDAFRRLISGVMSDEEIAMHSRSGSWGDDGAYLKSVRDAIRAKIEMLCGKNLACWCRLDEACHADILLQFAKAQSRPEAKPDLSQKMNALEEENARLKRLVSDLTLEKQALKGGKKRK